ncbi:hypothetical protein JEU11_03725 [Paraglaciecola chathamensis]|uniref:Uncharacterized protein n=1 Tax=Paraglaciecola chathamensis TaxID=368405 RepID=A0ABS0WAQ3_9ALTE|nr:hypothetical protein [Paraglaciecola chathamensis]MBJ2135553.1 hypothetical protein [Paraglaciecola chathamensis]|tara:strand:+ start:7173 stop:7490 length:318 start_codon:yes stop_codon:yes gene_type:complete
MIIINTEKQLRELLNLPNCFLAIEPLSGETNFIKLEGDFGFVAPLAIQEEWGDYSEEKVSLSTKISDILSNWVDDDIVEHIPIPYPHPLKNNTPTGYLVRWPPEE